MHSTAVTKKLPVFFQDKGLSNDRITWDSDSNPCTYNLGYGYPKKNPYYNKYGKTVNAEYPEQSLR